MRQAGNEAEEAEEQPCVTRCLRHGWPERIHFLSASFQGSFQPPNQLLSQ